MVVETSRQIVEVAWEIGVYKGTLGAWVNKYRADHAGDEPCGRSTTTPATFPRFGCVTPPGAGSAACGNTCLWKHLRRVPVPFGELAWDHVRASLPKATEEELADAVAALLDRAHTGPDTGQSHALAQPPSATGVSLPAPEPPARRHHPNRKRRSPQASQTQTPRPSSAKTTSPWPRSSR